VPGEVCAVGVDDVGDPAGFASEEPLKIEGVDAAEIGSAAPPPPIIASASWKVFGLLASSAYRPSKSNGLACVSRWP